MKQQQIRAIDLNRIAGSGDFPCPNCGTIISPDDETEMTYAIVEAKVKNGNLEEVEIRCNKCASHISLTGFSALQKVQN
jgi:hypothetical protein